MDRRRVVIALAAAAFRPSPSAGQETGVQSFTSGGVAIGVDWFPAASGQGRRPGAALLLLHGADGVPSRYAPAARTLAGAGYAVALVHYLDRTGDRRVGYGTLARDYPLWRGTVGDALGWLADRPEVDGGRMGIVGISLGAALALSTAAVDRRVKAIVDYFGPVPQDVAAARPRLPPTLILHGEDDRIVPVHHARDLQALLTAEGVTHEIKTYPGQGHILMGPAQLDAAFRTAAFLGRHL